MIPMPHRRALFARQVSVYETNGVTPRLLYAELFHRVMTLAPALYAEELVALVATLARYPTLDAKPTVVPTPATNFE